MFIAIALAAGAFFITVHFTAKPEQQQAPIVEPRTQMQDVPTVDIYTAKQDISIGTVITPDMLDLHPWPKNLLLPDMVVVDPSHSNDIVKMIVRTPFQKGEPIIMNKLANANDPSFLASSLGEGMRLVTVAVDAVSGGGGFVFPGDRVDVLITHDVFSHDELEGNDPSAKRDVVKQPVTEVLVPNIRVMATNQKSTAHGGDAPVVPANLSLEVTAEDAQKIRLAENGNGRLSVALRSLKDKDTSALVRPSGITDLSAVRIVPNPDNNEITVVRGVKAESVGVSKQ
jgi:pilus assembly protein CpaB